MKSREEIKQWLLENCINEYGNLDLSFLDFSDFEGKVSTSYMKVKYDLWQIEQTVEGNLYQYNQKVEGDLLQGCQTVVGKLYQDNKEVEENEK